MQNQLNRSCSTSKQPSVKNRAIVLSHRGRVLKDHKLSIMAGHDAGTHHQFTGIAKYFNSYTITGRRNCVLATKVIM
ncbi:hypothetical protein Q5P01_026222 [Channa striata]|uniref:Uncharacterized protein n=1 Tax=Channa striata TaxID=64152 RepID=A0AA88IZJ3_CHASR|nr:hypothetical protein Q5P01_026222 [Channa striata]